MAWTYLSTAPGSCTRSWVRMRVGDNTSADQLMQDEEIDAILTDMGGDQYFGAARCARQISAHFARRVDKGVGRLRIASAQASEQYEKLACSLEIEGGMRAKPYAGGISIADKDSVLGDTDRVAPAFAIGMTDFPGTLPTTS